MLLHEFYPNDIRVSKESSALIKAGFEVHLICLSKKGQDQKESINGLVVHRLNFAQSFFWRGIWDILLVLLGFIQPIFLKKLLSLHQKEKFDAIHVHDLPLAKTALKFKKSHPNVFVLADFHENYPEALKVWFEWKKNPIIRLKNRLFFGYEKWLKYEKFVAEHVDQLIVVVQEMKARIADIHGIKSKKITVVTNSEGIEFLDQKHFPEIYEKEKGDFILAYTGNVGPHRGVDTIVEALSFLKDQKSIKLEITGTLSGNSKSALQLLAQNHGVVSQVVFNGYQPFEKFFSYMYYADVNLIPHKRNGHTDNTIPHKLFQGMMVGKPVLVSDAPPLKRVTESLDAGLVFEAGNPADAADRIRSLFNSKEKCKALGNNGAQQTLQGKANWEHDSKNLTDLYTSLIDE